VAVTLVAAPLAWIGVQVKWIHDRHRALKSRPDFGYNPEDWETEEFGAPLAFEGPVPGMPPEWHPRVHAPWSIRILGESGVEKIVLPGQMDSLEETLDEMLRLFPEAHIQVVIPAVPLNSRAKRP
jgi:hypothetical protein